MKRIAIAAVLVGICFVTVSPAQHSVVVSPQEPPPASGWMGVDIQRGVDDAGNKLKYPVITLVYPGSPADHAGITIGDTLLKFDDINADVDAFGLRRLLKPGRRVQLKLRHNGVRTVTVVAGKRPTWTDSDLLLSSTPLRYDIVTQTLSPIAAPLDVRVNIVIPGASVVQMNADLAEALHVQNRGVLVLVVAPATPAMRAGLKGGDVIVKADTMRVTTPNVLSRAMSAKTAHDSAELNIVRMGKERKIKLRW